MLALFFSKFIGDGEEGGRQKEGETQKEEERLCACTSQFQESSVYSKAQEISKAQLRGKCPQNG